MKAKFIEITSFDREVEDCNNYPIWHLKEDKIGNLNNVSINTHPNDNVTENIIRKVYHRRTIVESHQGGYQPYIYFVNYEDIRHAVPIIMSEVHALEEKHKKEIEELRSEFARERHKWNFPYRNLTLKDKIRNTLKVWFK